MSLRVIKEMNFKEFYDLLSRPHKENKGMQKWLDIILKSDLKDAQNNKLPISKN